MADSRSGPRVRCPAGLSIPGQRLWRNVTEAYELRVDELVLLEVAAKTLDTVTALDAALVDQPLVVAGSMGQQREHPLLSEARQQRAALARLLRQLALPEVDEFSGAAARSHAGRALAYQRWAR